MESSDKIQQYIPAFEKKLDAISIDNLSGESYYKKYLGHLLQHKRYYLEIYSFVLENLLKNASLPKEKIILVDYGAGNGLLGLFAKYCGFDKVYINDINSHFTDSARELSHVLDIDIDDLITGDIEAVANYFQSVKPSAIVGTDVIEHIYDLDIFFNEVRNINPEIISVFTTASNPFNKYKIHQLRKLQLKDELKGGMPDDYVLFGETAMEPFIKTREKIIRKNFSSLKEDEMLQLAKLTRGLNEKDILIAVEEYVKDSILPKALTHPTNTCDPVTGSWTERILTLPEYKKIYADNGFEVKLYSGFYNEYSTGIKNLLMKLANRYIKISGNSIAPFICLAGIPNN